MSGLRFQVQRNAPLVGVITEKVEGVTETALGVAPGVAHTSLLDFHHIGAKPGEKLGAGRSRFILRQVENPQSIECGHRGLLPPCWGDGP